MWIKPNEIARDREQDEKCDKMWIKPHEIAYEREQDEKYDKMLKNPHEIACDGEQDMPSDKVDDEERPEDTECHIKFNTGRSPTTMRARTGR